MTDIERQEIIDEERTRILGVIKATYAHHRNDIRPKAMIGDTVNMTCCEIVKGIYGDLRGMITQGGRLIDMDHLKEDI